MSYYCTRDFFLEKLYSAVLSSPFVPSRQKFQFRWFCQVNLVYSCYVTCIGPLKYLNRLHYHGIVIRSSNRQQMCHILSKLVLDSSEITINAQPTYLRLLNLHHLRLLTIVSNPKFGLFFHCFLSWSIGSKIHPKVLFHEGPRDFF